MSGKSISEKQKKYSLQSWSKQKAIAPIAVERGEGIYFYDYDGNRYSDMSSQLVNLNLGFGIQEINDAIKEQVDQFCFVGPGYGVKARGDLAEMIIDLLPDNFGKVFFTNAGAEANENAIKMARMYTGRNKVLSRYRSYHGASFGAGNLTGEPRRFPMEPGIPGFIKFFDPYIYREPIEFADEKAATAYYLAKLEEQIRYEGVDKIAAIILETVTGSNGVIIPPEGYLPGVRALCDKYGIMLVCDEVMAGWYRTGTCFAFENFDIKPDMVTFAKGVTCGYAPLGGVAVAQKIADYFEENFLSCGLTYQGHPLGCAAGIACINYYKTANIAENVAISGKALQAELEALKEKHPCVGDVRCIGLFSAIELVKSKETKEALVPYGEDPEGIMGKIGGELKKRRFMTYTHENVVFVNPPLIITPEQIKEEMAKMDEVLSIVDAEYL